VQIYDNELDPNSSTDDWETITPAYLELTEGLAPLKTKLGKTMDLGQIEVAVVALYIVLTWVYERFPQVPIFRALGTFCAGKTRLTRDVMGPVLYKVFEVTGSPTEADIRRTMMLSHRRGPLRGRSSPASPYHSCRCRLNYPQFDCRSIRCR